MTGVQTCALPIYSREYLREHPELARELENKVRTAVGVAALPGSESKPAKTEKTEKTEKGEKAEKSA